MPACVFRVNKQGVKRRSEFNGGCTGSVAKLNGNKSRERLSLFRHLILKQTKMASNLNNKTVLVTGSTSGLGKQLALELTKSGGPKVIVHGKDQQKAAALIKELDKINPKVKHQGIVCDFNQPSTIVKAFGQIKKLDILINNAGVWAEGNTIAIKPSRIIELVNVNLLSYLMTSSILLPILLKSEFAQILNVISVAGYEVPTEYYHTIYSATKYDLQGFTEAMAKEFDNKKLRVMGYYPGGMDTELFTKAGMDYKQHEPWMFNPIESVEAIIFMLTRNPKVNIKRMDLINHLQISPS